VFRGDGDGIVVQMEGKVDVVAIVVIIVIVVIVVIIIIIIFFIVNIALE
jgi:hypothetical protein